MHSQIVTQLTDIFVYISQSLEFLLLWGIEESFHNPELENYQNYN